MSPINFLHGFFIPYALAHISDGQDKEKRLKFVRTLTYMIGEEKKKKAQIGYSSSKLASALLEQSWACAEVTTDMEGSVLPDICLPNFGEKTESTVHMYGDSLHLCQQVTAGVQRHLTGGAQDIRSKTCNSNSFAFLVFSAVQKKPHHVNVCFQRSQWPCPAAFPWLKYCQLWINFLFFSSP